MAWRFAQCWGKKARLEAYLKEGWDPFAVTETWLRRSAAPEHASLVGSWRPI